MCRCLEFAYVRECHKSIYSFIHDHYLLVRVQISLFCKLLKTSIEKEDCSIFHFHVVILMRLAAHSFIVYS